MTSPTVDSRSDQPTAIFDDNLGTDGDLILDQFGWAITCTAPEHLEHTFHLIESASRDGAWVAVAASYELGLALEPCLKSLLKGGPSPLLRAWVFWRGTRQKPSATECQLDEAVVALGPDGIAAGIGGLKRSITEPSYTKAVQTLREAIANGECYQVNFTYRLHGELWGHPIPLYRALRKTQPSRYGALIHHPDGYLLSRSPELFIKRSGHTLTCKPMKGTTVPGGHLAESSKDIAENLMIVDLIRNDLGRLAPSGCVTTSRLFEIEQFPTLQQMTSTISATHVTQDLLPIFRALFPCGSVTGAPKIRAMEIIHELESAPRGIYCGAIGWVAPSGDFQFNVAIRTLEIRDNGATTVGVGSGITFDSYAAREWEECHLKENFLANARYPLRLIETIRRERNSATPFPLLEGHFDRLRHSAYWFDIPWDEAETRKHLAALASRPTRDVMRIRLTVGFDGNVEIRETPLEDLAPNQTVNISPTSAPLSDRLRLHKTTARAQYDQILSAAKAAGNFDVVFYNERGEITEGARSNIFVQIQSRLFTPPLASGVLPGVLRGALISNGIAFERRITLSDLLSADRIFVGNALRGLIPVTLSE